MDDKYPQKQVDELRHEQVQAPSGAEGEIHMVKFGAGTAAPADTQGSAAEEPCTSLESAAPREAAVHQRERSVPEVVTDKYHWLDQPTNTYGSAQKYIHPSSGSAQTTDLSSTGSAQAVASVEPAAARIEEEPPRTRGCCCCTWLSSLVGSAHSEEPLESAHSEEPLEDTLWQRCQYCEEREATLFCGNCDILYCKECSDRLHQPEAMKKHQIVPAPDHRQTEAMLRPEGSSAPGGQM